MGRLGRYLVIACLVASTAQAADLESYLTGEIVEMEVLETPVSLATHRITYPDGNGHPLADKNGKVLLVNPWSRGRVPCKDEMHDLGDDRFEVVALRMEKSKSRSVRKTPKVRALVITLKNDGS